MDPLDKFRQWLSDELELSKVRIPTACCLSTIGTDGYPNARFVAFKGIEDGKFVITGSVSSRKGVELHHVNRAALTFWWATTERQIRMQGSAAILDHHLADKYFAQRNRESQIVSIVSDQGQPLHNLEILHHKFQDVESRSENQTLKRPENWGGYAIQPLRIEFLEFKSTRFHERLLYELNKGIWTETILQP